LEDEELELFGREVCVVFPDETGADEDPGAV